MSPAVPTAPTPTGPVRPASPARPPLARHGADRPVAGVAAGVARHLGLSTAAVRWGFVLLTLAGGAGAALYAWLWLLMPEDAPGTPAADGAAGPAPTLAARLPEVAERVREGGWPLLLAAVLLGVGGIVAADGLGVDVDWALVGPVAVLVIGLGLAWMQLDLGRGGRGERGGRLVRLALGSGLVLLAVLALAVGAVGSGELWLGLVVAVAMLAGAALVAMPYLLAWQRRRDEERTALAVHAERAEIAAHLHDSVLQSLALIQRRAEDPETVARVARAQERELRRFLFPEAARLGGTLRERLEETAAEVEDAHGRRVEVVAVGEASGAWLEPLVAAAREAVLNAARHAGDVQVFAEVTDDDGAPRLAEVFVRDRGAGFDLDEVPADRMGVRESILGRMRRAGGSARLRSGPGGTEVHLALPEPADPAHPTDPREETA
ncbi:PspC domain-containing protein [Micrococcus sp. M4NT]|uniref:ATP-binding protein n=1 Tax=Micrococcus sp. M4NT TaxID=2957501 RepID=UPI0029A8C45C|nr:PspC domain-containing protein [Micrococcus sp. M4NT]MDX2340204.1 PspC domain-containing protein [Micrococcus sp. M4NT]